MLPSALVSISPKLYQYVSIRAVVCALCGEEAAPKAGCAMTLYAAPGVKVGEAWLPLCLGHVRYLAWFARESRREGRVKLRCSWVISRVQDGNGTDIA